MKSLLNPRCLYCWLRDFLVWAVMVIWRVLHLGVQRWRETPLFLLLSCISNPQSTSLVSEAMLHFFPSLTSYLLLFYLSSLAHCSSSFPHSSSVLCPLSMHPFHFKIWIGADTRPPFPCSSELAVWKKKAAISSGNKAEFSACLTLEMHLTTVDQRS